MATADPSFDVRPVGALAPALREALLTGFLSLLQRPAPAAE